MFDAHIQKSRCRALHVDVCYVEFYITCINDARSGQNSKRLGLCAFIIVRFVAAFVLKSAPRLQSACGVLVRVW